jgi:FixJ family two-component response regulator
LDIIMPGATGLQLQAELKKRKINLPIIAVSARDDADTSNRARQLGARLFLRKPVDDQALLDAIRWVLESDCPKPASG